MKIQNSTSPEEMYVGLQIDFYGGFELIRWARATPHLDEHANDWEVAELFCANEDDLIDVEQSIKRFNRIYARYWKEAKIPSDRTEEIAQRLFAGRLSEYLNGECKPIDVCRVFHSIEAIFDFPEWLGDMYNACDWVEPETVSSDCPYLGEESARLLSTFLNSK